MPKDILLLWYERIDDLPPLVPQPSPFYQFIRPLFSEMLYPLNITKINNMVALSSKIFKRKYHAPLYIASDSTDIIHLLLHLTRNQYFQTAFNTAHWDSPNSNMSKGIPWDFFMLIGCTQCCGVTFLDLVFIWCVYIDITICWIQTFSLHLLKFNHITKAKNCNK